MTKAKEDDFILTQEYLKKILSYNNDTGIFTYLTQINSRALKGQLAGYVNTQGYISIMIRGKSYLAHRLAFLYDEGVFPPEQVDHGNGVRSDNRLINLKKVSDLKNKKNLTINSKNKSGVIGVYWFDRDQKWHAQIQVNKKKVHLGYFDDIKDAKEARKQAECHYGFHVNHGKNLDRAGGQ